MKSELHKALTLLINEDREAAVSVLRDAILEAAKDIKQKLDEEDDLEIVAPEDDLDDIEVDEVEGAEFDGDEVEVDDEVEVEEEPEIEDVVDRIEDVEAHIAELQAEMDRLRGEEVLDDVDGEEEIEVEDEIVSEEDFTSEFETLDADFDDFDLDAEVDFDIDLEEGKSFRHSEDDDEEVDFTAKRKASKEDRAARRREYNHEREDELVESIGEKVAIPANKEGRLAGTSKTVAVKKNSTLPKQEPVIKTEAEPIKTVGGKTKNPTAPKKPKLDVEIKNVKNAPHVKVIGKK